MNQRSLVVNADDFGQSAGINLGVIECCERGVVTSASLMVLWPASAEAASYLRTRHDVSAGLHVDLGEWVYRDGSWHALYERVALSRADLVEMEIRRQLQCCRDLLGHNPTHLDSHQHVHCREPVRSILLRLAGEIGVPLRHFAPGIRHYGAFYGQDVRGVACRDAIGVARLVSSLDHLADGVTEMACHPGYADDLDTMYGVERAIEVQTLCAREVRDAIETLRIGLVSFVDLRTA